MHDFRGKRADIGVYDDAMWTNKSLESLISQIEKTDNKVDLRNTWLVTPNVYDLLYQEHTVLNSKLVVVPTYILPLGEQVLELSNKRNSPNRAERRKQQREERRKNKREEQQDALLF